MGPIYIQIRLDVTQPRLEGKDIKFELSHIMGLQENGLSSLQLVPVNFWSGTKVGTKPF